MIQVAGMVQLKRKVGDLDRGLWSEPKRFKRVGIVLEIRMSGHPRHPCATVMWLNGEVFEYGLSHLKEAPNAKKISYKRFG
jgi:hypothetical protein